MIHVLKYNVLNYVNTLAKQSLNWDTGVNPLVASPFCRSYC